MTAEFFVNLEDVCIELKDEEVFDYAANHLYGFVDHLTSCTQQELAGLLNEDACKVAVNQLNIDDVLDTLAENHSPERLLKETLDTLEHYLSRSECQVILEPYFPKQSPDLDEILDPEQRSQFAKDLPVDIVLAALAHKLNEAV